MSVRAWMAELAGVGEDSIDSGRAEEVYTRLFSADVRNPQVAALQNDIWDHDVDIKKAVGDRALLDGDWPGLTELARSYLYFCRQVDPHNTEDSFEAYARFYQALQAAYAGTNGAVLNGAVKHSTQIMVRQFGRVRAPARWTADVLLRLFNSIRSDKAPPGTPTKRHIVLYVATTLCRLYFWIGNPAQCANVFNNIHTAVTALSNYPLAQQVEFRYWLGRFHLNRGECVAGFKHLWWAYVQCPGGVLNKVIILRQLVTPAILVGMFPKRDVIDAIGLSEPLGLLMECLRRPSAGLACQLEQHSWFESMRLGHLLRQTLPLLVVRRAVVRLRKIENDKPRLSFADLHAALRLAGCVDADPGFVVTESMAVALINAGYLYANVFPLSSVVSLRPQNPLPPVLEVTRALSNELGIKEQWMAR